MVEGVGQQLESVVVGQMLEVELGKRMAGMVILDCIDNKKVVAVEQRMVGLVVSKVGKEIRMVVVVGFAAEQLEEIEVDIELVAEKKVEVGIELVIEKEEEIEVDIELVVEKKEEEIEIEIDSLVLMEVVVDIELPVVVEVVLIDIGSLEVFVEFEEELNIVSLAEIVEVMELGFLVV